jgi:hypothetical protein
MNDPAMNDGNTKHSERAGRKEGRAIFLKPADAKELKRVVSARGDYKSVPHLLRDYLDRSLLPRIREGRCFPGRLLAETAGRSPAGDQSRRKVQLGLKSWNPVAAAACKLRRDLRRLEEGRAWKGGVGALPFCRCGTAEVVRAAAREIGTWSRGGPSELFSREEASGWLGPSPVPGEDLGEELDEKVGGMNSEASSQGKTYQVLAKLPDRERGGKPVQFFITDKAKGRLKRKGNRLNQDGSHLARRGTRLLVGWTEEAPAEAYQYISEESSLYREPREGSISGFQVYVAEETKRRVERAKARLKRKPGYGAQADEKGILQAAARLVIESDDEKMRPPLPGAGADR